LSCRYESTISHESNWFGSLKHLIVVVNVLAVILGFAFVNLISGNSEFSFRSVADGVAVAVAAVALGFLAHRISCFPHKADPQRQHQYRVPGVPVIPIIGIIVNYWLIAQQPLSSLWLVICYLGLGTVCYLTYSIFDTQCEWKNELLIASDAHPHWSSISAVEGTDSPECSTHNETFADVGVELPEKGASSKPHFNPMRLFKTSIGSGRKSSDYEQVISMPCHSDDFAERKQV
jgi:hypothetical protein